MSDGVKYLIAQWPFVQAGRDAGALLSSFEPLARRFDAWRLRRKSATA